MIIDCAHYLDGKRQHSGAISLEEPQLTTGDEVIYHKGAEANVAIGGLGCDGDCGHGW